MFYSKLHDMNSLLHPQCLIITEYLSVIDLFGNNILLLNIFDVINYTNDFVKTIK